MRKKGSPLNLDECPSRQRPKRDARKNEEEDSGTDICNKKGNPNYLRNPLEDGRGWDVTGESEDEKGSKSGNEYRQPGDGCC